MVRQSTLSSRSSENRSKATLTFADYNLFDFAGHQIWEVFARALQGMETPLDVRLVKMGRS
jgi:hypothetical protein